MGIVNLSSNSMQMIVLDVLRSKIGPPDAGLCRWLAADYFIPDPESVRTLPAVRFSAEPMASRAAGCTDWPTGRYAAVGVTSRREPRQPPLAVPRWVMRMRGAVVEPPLGSVFHVRQHVLLGRRVAAALVRDQHPWDVGAAGEQCAQ